MSNDELSVLKDHIAALTARVTQIEDLAAIRRLHWAYGYYIDYNDAQSVSQLFHSKGEVIFLSGIYRGPKGALRLYGEWFQNYFTQGRPGPVYGLVLDHFQMQDIIDISPDGKTAKGRFRALLLGGNHESRSYKPEGLPEQFFEAGVYENEYEKEDGVWKIKKLDYVVAWQAEYVKGLAHDEAHLKPLARTFPEDPLGPDELLPEAERRAMWPNRTRLEMHFAHPVLGKTVMPTEAPKVGH